MNGFVSGFLQSVIDGSGGRLEPNDIDRFDSASRELVVSWIAELRFTAPHTSDAFLDQYPDGSEFGYALASALRGGVGFEDYCLDGDLEMVNVELNRVARLLLKPPTWHVEGDRIELDG